MGEVKISRGKLSGASRGNQLAFKSLQLISVTQPKLVSQNSVVRRVAVFWITHLSRQTLLAFCRVPRYEKLHLWLASGWIPCVTGMRLLERWSMKKPFKEALIDEFRQHRPIICATTLGQACPQLCFSGGQTATILIVDFDGYASTKHGGVFFSARLEQKICTWMGIPPGRLLDQPNIAILSIKAKSCCVHKMSKPIKNKPIRTCWNVWRLVIPKYFPNLELILAIGWRTIWQCLGNERRVNVFQTVQGRNQYLIEGVPLPNMYRTFPLPHPSWGREGWDEDPILLSDQVIPELQRIVRPLL